jgi:hypothetical protein
MKRFIIIVIILALAACRGEPVPRDYQNAPPNMTHPPQSATQAPGQGKAVPEPSTGAEGKANPSEPVTPPAKPQTTTMPDTPPVTTTT